MTPVYRLLASSQKSHPNGIGEFSRQENFANQTRKTLCPAQCSPRENIRDIHHSQNVVPMGMVNSADTKISPIKQKNSVSSVFSVVKKTYVPRENIRDIHHSQKVVPMGMVNSNTKISPIKQKYSAPRENIRDIHHSQNVVPTTIQPPRKFRRSNKNLCVLCVLCG